MKRKYVCFFICKDCGYRFKGKAEGWYSGEKCPKCGGIAATVDATGTSFSFKKYRDVVAFGHDTKTGQPIWIDSKGNRLRHDSPEVRYNLQSDPHGWRATGKKVRGGE
jgi:hypothetical protein